MESCEQTIRTVVAVYTNPKDDLIRDLLSALKECALQIAQTHNRRLTTNEQIALENARDVIAKADGRS